MWMQWIQQVEHEVYLFFSILFPSSERHSSYFNRLIGIQNVFIFVNASAFTKSSEVCWRWWSLLQCHQFCFFILVSGQYYGDVIGNAVNYQKASFETELQNTSKHKFSLCAIEIMCYVCAYVCCLQSWLSWCVQWLSVGHWFRGWRVEVRGDSLPQRHEEATSVFNRCSAQMCSDVLRCTLVTMVEWTAKLRQFH